MNYAFVSDMNQTQAKKLLDYLTDSLRNAKKHRHMQGMVPVWKTGKVKVRVRIQELEKQKA